MSVTKKFYLTFPKNKISEPVICAMYDQHKVQFNIRSASVTDEIGIMALELIADSAEKIQAAVTFFKTAGLTVDPIEMDVITG